MNYNVKQKKSKQNEIKNKTKQNKQTNKKPTQFIQ